MTYAQLVQLLQDFVESSESTLVADIDYIIEFAEKRIYRTIDLNACRKYSTTSLSAGDEFISLPSDVVVIRSLQIKDSNEDRTFLQQKDMSFLDEYMVDRDSQGTPRYYAWYNATTAMIAPSANTTFTVELAYTYRPTQLSSGNTTTWLSNNAPDVLHYACLLELATFLKEEADIIKDYTDKYQQAATALLMEENNRNRKDVHRDREIKVEV